MAIAKSYTEIVLRLAVSTKSWPPQSELSGAFTCLISADDARNFHSASVLFVTDPDIDELERPRHLRQRFTVGY